MTVGDGRSFQVVPMSAMRSCPTLNMSPSHWSHYHLDGKCNHGRLCGYRDENGGPCRLGVDGHPKRVDGTLIHDDGTRWDKGAWRR